MPDDLRHRYAEALASTNMLDETDLEFTLHLVLGIHEEETAKLREERDLAIAHDRQPYPTAWAYEQACKALELWRERAEQAEAKLSEVLQASRGWQITYCDEVNARMEWARRAVEAEERAEKAEAGIARVRALHTSFSRRDGVPYCDHCSVSAGSPWRRYVLVPWPCETLAALDDTREDEDHG